MRAELGERTAPQASRTHEPRRCTRIPGQRRRPPRRRRRPRDAAAAAAARAPSTRCWPQSQVEAVLDELERDLVGLAPVKQRIRDIAALLVIDKLRLNLGLASAGARACT